MLIQQHLVLWYDPDDSNRAFYEADLANAYALARSGKYIQLIKDQLDGFSSDVISNIILLGHVSVGDLTRTYFPPSGGQGPLYGIITSDNHLRPNDNEVAAADHATKEDVHTVDELHSTISSFLSSGLLRLLHESYLRPAADNIAEAEHIVPRDPSHRLKKDEQVAWEVAVKNKLEDWRYGSKSETRLLPQPQKGTKRGLDDTESIPRGKKAKFNDSRSNGTGSNSQSPQSGWLDVGLLLRHREL